VVEGVRAAGGTRVTSRPRVRPGPLRDMPARWVASPESAHLAGANHRSAPYRTYRSWSGHRPPTPAPNRQPHVYRQGASNVDGRTVKDWSGRIEPPPSEFFHAKAKYTDFIGTETGRLFVRCLPPGTYQVGPYSYHGVIPGVASIYWKAANFAPLAFHIRSGEATYIGSFMRAPSLPTSLRPILGARGFFVIADRSSRDLPIAQGRLPAQMKVMKEVLDVSGSTDPALRTSEP